MIRIDWSAEAAEALRAEFGLEGPVWKLVYDSEGCGCAVSGVPALWAVEAPLADDVKAEGGPVRVWYEKRHEVFFDERMRVDYDAAGRRFRLLSDGQIYTNRLAVVDRREVRNTF